MVGIPRMTSRWLSTASPAASPAGSCGPRNAARQKTLPVVRPGGGILRTHAEMHCGGHSEICDTEEFRDRGCEQGPWLQADRCDWSAGPRIQARLLAGLWIGLVAEVAQSRLPRLRDGVKRSLGIASHVYVPDSPPISHPQLCAWDGKNTPVSASPPGKLLSIFTSPLTVTQDISHFYQILFSHNWTGGFSRGHWVWGYPKGFKQERSGNPLSSIKPDMKKGLQKM